MRYKLSRPRNWMTQPHSCVPDEMQEVFSILHLLYKLEDLEHRQVHGDDDAADYRTDDHDH